MTGDMAGRGPLRRMGRKDTPSLAVVHRVLDLDHGTRIETEHSKTTTRAAICRLKDTDEEITH